MALAPKDARNFNDVCSLQTDGHSTKAFWICLNGGTNVIISKQTSGKEREAWVEIPKRDFLALIRWYQKPQKMRTK